MTPFINIKHTIWMSEWNFKFDIRKNRRTRDREMVIYYTRTRHYCYNYYLLFYKLYKSQRNANTFPNLRHRRTIKAVWPCGWGIILYLYLRTLFLQSLQITVPISRLLFVGGPSAFLRNMKYSHTLDLTFPGYGNNASSAFLFASSAILY